MIAELSPRASKHGLKNSRNQDIYPKGMSATIRQLIHVNLQRKFVILILTMEER